jgi:hypothetical protein
MLRSWTQNRTCIAEQKRGLQQSRIAQKGRENIIKVALYKEFREGRKLGKAIRAQWFRRYTKAFYCQQYLQKIT